MVQLTELIERAKAIEIAVSDAARQEETGEAAIVIGLDVVPIRGLTLIAIHALRDLLLALEQVALAELPAEPPPGKTHATLERNRHVRALMAVARFVRLAWDHEASPKVQSHFFKWAATIEQLNDGTQHPNLVPSIRRGPKDDLTEISRARGDVCLAVWCYERADRKRKRTTIIEEIASDKQHRALERLIRDGHAKHGLRGAIKSWYAHFQQGTANEIAQGGKDGWRELCAFIDASAAGDSAKYIQVADTRLKAAVEEAAAITPDKTA